MNNNEETLKEAMEKLKTKNHRIGLVTGRSMTAKMKAFKEKNKYKKKGEALEDMPEIPQSVTFNKQAVESLLSTPGCEAFRIYYGINNDNQVIPILVAVDGEGMNLLGETAGNAEENSNLRAANEAAAAPEQGPIMDEGQINPPFHPEGGL